MSRRQIMTDISETPYGRALSGGVLLCGVFFVAGGLETDTQDGCRVYWPGWITGADTRLHTQTDPRTKWSTNHSENKKVQHNRRKQSSA